MSKSRWISDLHWVRTGQQSRSQKTQDSLLDAAALLFAEKGVDATSVADVAARAGCSVGSVYHHFRDKKALLYARLRSHGARSSARPPGRRWTRARWEGASIADILRGYLEFSLETAPRPSCRSTIASARGVAQRPRASRASTPSCRSELVRGSDRAPARATRRDRSSGSGSGRGLRAGSARIDAPDPAGRDPDAEPTREPPGRGVRAGGASLGVSPTWRCRFLRIDGE